MTYADYDTNGDSPERSAHKLCAIDQERRKYEAYWSALNIPVAVGSTVNIISALEAIAPAQGPLMSSSRFFDLILDRIKPYSEPKSMYVKLMLGGTYSGGSTNRQLECAFNLQYADIYTAGRVTTPPVDRYAFTNIISVDANGFAATNGFSVTLTAYGGTFTITEAKLIVEQ